MNGITIQAGHFHTWTIVLLVALLALPAPAAELTVKKSGGDYSAIQDALDAAGAGDTVTVYAGTYNERLWVGHGGSAGGGWLTLTVHSNDAVYLNGGSVHSASDPNMIEFESGISFFRIEHLNICSNLADSADGGAGILLDGHGHHIEILSNRIYEMRGEDGIGIAMFGSHATSPISNLLIAGNEIFDCEPAQSEALVLNANVCDFRITGNDVHDVNNIGIDFIGGEDWLPLNAARDGICADNRVVRARSSYGGGYAAGIYVDGGRDIVIERNEVTECDMGIEIGAENPGWQTTNITVRANLVHNNDKIGLVFGGYDAGRGRVDHCRFLNNTLYKNANASDWQAEIIVNWAASNEVRNNLVVLSAAGDRYAVLDAANTGNISNVFDHNLYYYAGTPEDALFEWQNTTCYGFTQYQAAASTAESNSLFSDPAFAGSPTNLRVALTSPAVDAGDDTALGPEHATDADGRLRPLGEHVDIGAYEYAFLECLSTGTIEIVSGTLTTRWSSVRGARYRVEQAERVTNAAWTTLTGPVTATTDRVTGTEPIGSRTQQFYRCLRLLP